MSVGETSVTAVGPTFALDVAPAWHRVSGFAGERTRGKAGGP